MPPIQNTNMLILLNAAKELGIKTKILSTDPVKIRFTKNQKSHLISEKSMHLNTSKKAITLAKDKSLTLQTLVLNNLPVQVRNLP